MKNVLIIGATSAIAEQTARKFASDGDALFLVARDMGKLQAVAADLETRGAGKVAVRIMNALDYDAHRQVIEEAMASLGGLDMAMIAYGVLPDQEQCQVSFQLTREMLEVNCLSVMSLLTHLGNHFETQKSGTIIVLSSVAGDRGRQSNYVYGAAKGALSIFLQGLRNRLHQSNVAVITIKLGFVDTPMTSAFKKGLLWTTAKRAGGSIHRISARKGGEFYVPFFWRGLMRVVRSIPDILFRRLGL